MKRLLRKLEAMLTAAAFAEEGEVETARKMVEEASAEIASLPRSGGGRARSPSTARGRIRRLPLAKSSGT